MIDTKTTANELDAIAIIFTVPDPARAIAKLTNIERTHITDTLIGIADSLRDQHLIPNPDAELTPENLAEAAQTVFKPHLPKNALNGTQVTITRDPYHGHTATITSSNCDGTVNAKIDGTSVTLENLQPGIHCGHRVFPATKAS